MAMVVPLAIGGGMVAAGVGGAIGSGALGGTPGVDQPGMNPNAFYYGGDPDYYKQRRDYLDKQERAAGDRGAYQADFGQANGDYANAGLARAQQQAAVDQYGKVINGTAGPSLAEQQMRAGQAVAAQNAMQMAASARGGTGAQMAAQRQAQQQAMIGQAGVARDAGMLRAREVQAARDAQAGLLGTMRQEDYAGRAGSQQQALAQGGLEMQQRQLNDQRSLGLISASNAATMGNMQGLTSFELAQAQNNRWAQGENANIEERNHQRSAQFWGSIIGAGGSMMGKGAVGGGGGGGGG